MTERCALTWSRNQKRLMASPVTRAPAHARVRECAGGMYVPPLTPHFLSLAYISLSVCVHRRGSCYPHRGLTQEAKTALYIYIISLLHHPRLPHCRTGKCGGVPASFFFGRKGREAIQRRRHPSTPHVVWRSSPCSPSPPGVGYPRTGRHSHLDTLSGEGERGSRETSRGVHAQVGEEDDNDDTFMGPSSAVAATHEEVGERNEARRRERKTPSAPAPGKNTHTHTHACNARLSETNESFASMRVYVCAGAEEGHEEVKEGRVVRQKGKS